MGLDKDSVGTSLVVQWLRLHTPSVGDTGAIPRGVGGELRSHMAKKKKKKKNLLRISIHRGYSCCFLNLFVSTSVTRVKSV